MLARNARAWTAFCRSYLAEMNSPAARHELALQAALSHQANFSVGCYCADERRCHRSILRELLAAHGAVLIVPRCEPRADAAER